MQANELAYHCLQILAQDRKLLGQKGCYSQHRRRQHQHRVPLGSPCQVPQEDTRRLKEMPYVQALVSQLKISGVQETPIFLKGLLAHTSTQTASQRKAIYVLPQLENKPALCARGILHLFFKHSISFLLVITFNLAYPHLYLLITININTKYMIFSPTKIGL